MTPSIALVVALVATSSPEPSKPKLPAFQPGTPLLQHGAQTRCVPRQDLRWRTQCDSEKRTCLIAPDVELNSDLTPGAPLDRADYCFAEMREDELEGFTLVPAVAAAPPGWRRDERQRIMQVNFDLNRRLYVGGAWAPVGTAPGAGHALVAAGFRAEWLSDEWDDDESRTLTRLTLLDGEAFVDGSSIDAVAVQLDTSRSGNRPGIRISTFVGAPRRFDVELNFNYWVEALRFEQRWAPDARYSRLSFGNVGGTLDLWQSKGLESYVRLRVNVGMERDIFHGVLLGTPGGAAEADLTLDTNGFHHLRSSATFERVLPLESGWHPANRIRLELGYELVFLALNDQPLTAFVEGRLEKRGDIPERARDWEYLTLAGARFSFWAPARREAPVQTAL